MKTLSLTIPLILCTILAGCGGGAPPPEPAPTPPPPTQPTPPPRVDLEPLCRGLANSYDCGQAIERHQLRRAPQLFSRAGDTLTVHLADHQGATFVDRDVEDEAGVAYTYREFIPGVAYHLIHAHLYEGTAFLLIGHRTGDVARLQALPVFSPDLGRFATASEDLDARYNATEIQIWRITQRSPVREWSHEPAGNPVALTPDAWGPTNLRWISSTEIRVQKVTLDPETLQRALGDDVVIRRAGGRWAIQGNRN